MTKRCEWAANSDVLMQNYHDFEWCKPKHKESMLFELLTLEGAQAGLSWSCIINKRENYKIAFDDFNIQKIANYSQSKIEELMKNEGIVRNRRKIMSTINNAQRILELGSLCDFLWSYVKGKSIVNNWERQEQMPATSFLSDKISKDMKKIGFSFVGSTIIYSYLQAVGIINDHMNWCDFG